MPLTVLLDGYSLFYRAYHALQTPMTAPDGTPTNALHSFMMMLLRVLEAEKPDRLIAAFDAHAPSFRKQIFDGYKASRKPMPDDLRAQDPIVRELLALMGVPVIEVKGYEADDVLGTLSRKAVSSGGKCLIVTGDRDSFQLVTDDVHVLYTRRGITDTVEVDPAWIRETYGVEPAQMIDVKSLMGDPSDDIPGVKGIGEKTALALIAKYGDMEKALLSAPEQKGALAQKLAQGAQSARMSLDLARIRLDVPVELEDSHVDPSGAVPRLKELAMMQCAARCAKLAPAQEPASAPEFRPEHTALSSAEELARAGVSGTLYLCGDDPVSAASGAGAYSLPLGGGDLLDPGVTREDALLAARSLCERADSVVAYDVKSLLPLPKEADDAMLAAYVLSPVRPSFSLKSLCEQEGVGFDPSCPACSLPALWEAYSASLAANDAAGIYRTIELPLAGVLRRMERSGFRVDPDTLKKLKAEFSSQTERYEREAHEKAGHPFNLNSPKQLAQVLYDELGLPSPRGKSRTTDAETLESLAPSCPLAQDVLEYRKYKKLESTYVDALLRLTDENCRVHSRFDQTATATGRISSNEPNLQNIPVRTPLGRSIRTAFIPDPGWVLIDADYSQIELRILAHICGDENMRRAFIDGDDIHARTAGEVYGVPPEQVTHEMRSRAKAVNFGIVYGISDFTLARNTGMSRAEARAFMDTYFERYPLVRRYMEESVARAKKAGYAETLMGRRRYLPELASPSFQVRAFGERCAMNSPIQGSAADIIKLAMIRADEALRREGLRARLILQVHDELILESPLDEADRAERVLRDAMEHVAELSVPLTAQISRGGSWSECK